MSVLGQYEVQFGIFKVKTFKWLVENGLGYAAWLVDSMWSETATTAPLSRNKHSFKRYLTSFPEGQSVVALKANERMKKSTSSLTQSKFLAFNIFMFISRANLTTHNIYLVHGFIECMF